MAISWHADKDAEQLKKDETAKKDSDAFAFEPCLEPKRMSSNSATAHVILLIISPLPPQMEEGFGEKDRKNMERNEHAFGCYRKCSAWLLQRWNERGC